MIYTTEVQHMCPVAKGAYHGPAPIPEEEGDFDVSVNEFIAQTLTQKERVDLGLVGR